MGGGNTVVFVRNLPYSPTDASLTEAWRRFAAHHVSAAFWREMVAVLGPALRRAHPDLEARLGAPLEAVPAAPVDAVSSASVYAKHDIVPRIAGLSPLEQRGERLFQDNCAFCHGADGTGKNWIGQFMQPKARDLTLYTVRSLPPRRPHGTRRRRALRSRSRLRGLRRGPIIACSKGR